MMGLARLLPAGVSADRTGGNAPSISETTRRIASDRSATNTSPPFLLPARPAICLYSPAGYRVIPVRCPVDHHHIRGKIHPHRQRGRRYNHENPAGPNSRFEELSDFRG